MIHLLTSLVKRLLGKDKPEFIHVQVPEQRIREMMKGERDFRIKVDLNGTVTAHCKACDCAMNVTESNGLMWFICPSCKQVSFYPISNLHRDTHFAMQDGVPLEYELFYLKDLPPGMRPPI